MKRSYLFTFCFLLILVDSCTPETKMDSQNTISNIKDPNEDSTSITTNSISSKKVEYETNNSQQEKSIVTKINDKQLSFCDCVIKSDSINKAIENSGNLDDKMFDELMGKFDEIEKQCKTLLSSPSLTPEERSAHDQKVKKCKEES